MDRSPDVIPGMRYRDAHAAMDFLERAFGFERVLVVHAEGGLVAHAQLRFGTRMIMLGSERPETEVRDMSPPGTQTPTMGVYCRVDDVEELFGRAREAGAEVVRELNDTDYGSRDCAFRDPEGLKKEVKKDPLDALRAILKRYHGKATTIAIKNLDSSCSR